MMQDYVFSPKPWRSRGYLPHYDQQHLTQMVTFRLADSLPRVAIDAMEEEMRALSTDLKNRKRLLEISKYLDRGMGACWLGQDRIAEMVENTLLHFDGERYELLAWCVMPNHVHVLLEVGKGYSLEKIVHTWKSFSANQANKLLERSGPFWQMEYFDRYIRNAEHYSKSRHYIEENPVKAKLVERASDWKWSSASRKWQS